MNLEITFEELNSLLAQKTKGFVTAKSLPTKNSFEIGVSKFGLPLNITMNFNRIEKEHTLIFDYKIPFLMNALINKFKTEINQIIPDGIVEIDEIGRAHV